MPSDNPASPEDAPPLAHVALARAASETLAKQLASQEALARAVTSSPALDALSKQLADQAALASGVTNTAAFEALGKELTRQSALAKAAASPALGTITNYSALAKAAAAQLSEASPSYSALNALAGSPALDAARKAFANSGALAALATSPATNVVAPSPLTTALLSAAAAPAPLPTSPPEPVALPTVPATPPHNLMPARLRREALKRVSQLGDRLMRRHEGAWDAISHKGPDSASQAAGSTVELIKGSLREAAPPERVNAWLQELGNPPWGTDRNGHPTNRARAQFVLTQDGIPRESAETLAVALVQLLADLEKVKHGSVDASLQYVASTLLLFEAMLVASSPPLK